MQTSDGDFKACKAKLSKLEAALRAMPEDDEDFANERAAIAAKITETESGMAENKTIGARIDPARTTLKLRLHTPQQYQQRSVWTTVDAVSVQLQLEWTPTWCPKLQLILHSSSRGFNMLSRKWSGNVVFKRTPQRDCAGNKTQKVHPLRPRMTIRT